MEKNSTLKKSFRAADFEKMTEKKNSENLVPPPKTIVNNILNYSKALSVIKTKQMGYVEFVLN